MRFYIDFENVGIGGLKGIDSLNEKDFVRVYYSNNPNIDMKTVENMMKSPANIKFLQLPDSLKKLNISNALDIVLMMDVSRIVASLGSDNYAAVVSKDKGYDSVINELNNANNFDKIFRTESIQAMNILKHVKDTLSDAVDFNAVEKLFNQGLKKYSKDKDKIVNILKTSKSRCEINNMIHKTFDRAQSKIIMTELKPIIKGLPGQ